MDRLSGETLLRLPVRFNGIHLGHPVDVVLDAEVRRVLGLDVRCGDDVHRFLPLGAAHAGDEELAIASTLMLLDPDQLAFYRKRGTTLRTLRGARVSLAGRDVGTLQDVVSSSDGALTHLVVENARHVPLDARVRIEVDPRRVDAA